MAVCMHEEFFIVCQIKTMEKINITRGYKIMINKHEGRTPLLRVVIKLYKKIM